MNESINKADEYKKKCSFFFVCRDFMFGKTTTKKKKNPSYYDENVKITVKTFLMSCYAIILTDFS